MLLAQWPRQWCAGWEVTLQLWFRGPRQVGDFLFQWFTSDHTLRHIDLSHAGQYTAIDPDGMLAVQEWHMASENMDTGSICPRCSAGGVQPITTGAVQQRFENPNRAVRFFCARCRSVHDQVALKPYNPALSRQLFWKQCVKFPLALFYCLIG